MSADRRRVTFRVTRPPRGVGLMLAIPAFLAIGTATLTLLLAGVATVLFAPALRGRRRHHDRDTVTLDPTAYRRLDDPALPIGPITPTSRS
jgi:hypothetical protein